MNSKPQQEPTHKPTTPFEDIVNAIAEAIELNDLVNRSEPLVPEEGVRCF